MRKEKTEDIHVNFRNKEEIMILVNALNDQWNQGALDHTGLALLILLESAIGKDETIRYIKEEPCYSEIERIIND